MIQSVFIFNLEILFLFLEGRCRKLCDVIVEGVLLFATLCDEGESKVGQKSDVTYGRPLDLTIIASRPPLLNVKNFLPRH